MIADAAYKFTQKVWRCAALCYVRQEMTHSHALVKYEWRCKRGAQFRSSITKVPAGIRYLDAVRAVWLPAGHVLAIESAPAYLARQAATALPLVDRFLLCR
jgi:hypothetical protein